MIDCANSSARCRCLFSAVIAYAAKSANTNYQFEVRDVATNTLLTSFTLAYTRFHNHTLVIKGLTGATGTNVLSVFSVSPY